MASSNHKTDANPIGAILFWLSAHNWLALLIIGTLSVPIIGFIQNELANWLDTSTSLGDIVFLGLIFDIGLVLGHVANRALHIRVASWSWILGLFWMIFGIRDALRTYDPRWHEGCSATQDVVNAFFIASHKCGGGEDVLYGLFFTLPALGLVGCSVGAWVASQRAHQDKRVAPPVHMA